MFATLRALPGFQILDWFFFGLVGFSRMLKKEKLIDTDLGFSGFGTRSFRGLSQDFGLGLIDVLSINF